MKKLMTLTLLALCISVNADHFQEVTLSHVGVSDNSGTIFFNTVEDIIETDCTNKKQFKVALDNRTADKMYSTALVALATKRKLSIHYHETNCIGVSAKVNVMFIGD